VIDDEERARATRSRTERQAAAWDKFLESSGIGLGGLFGVNLNGGGPSVKKVNSEGKTVTSTEPTFGGSAIIWLRMYRYVDIQSGINIIANYAPYTPSGGKEQYAKLTIFQIPLLARLNLELIDAGRPAEPGGTINICLAPYVGLGVNAITNSTSGSVAPGGMNLIAGVDLGYSLRNGFLGAGYQYNGGIGDSSITVNGTSYNYRQRDHSITMGFRILLPFRK
jgi:hypothetical protein